MAETGVPATPPPGAPSEPLLSVGAITALVVAAIALGVAFGLPVTDDQQAAILGIIAPLAAIAAAVWGRLKVWSPATVRAALLAKTAAERRSMPYTSPGAASNPIAPTDKP